MASVGYVITGIGFGDDIHRIVLVFKRLLALAGRAAYADRRGVHEHLASILAELDGEGVYLI